VIDLELAHAWAAGIVDGEGCIQIRRNRLGHQLMLTVGQSGCGTPLMLLKMQELFGGRIWPHRGAKKDGASRKPHFVWGVVARDAESALRAIEPYAVEKSDQIRLALEYREKGVGRGRFEIASGFRSRLQEIRS
jgi:hypothetical protein